MTDQPDIPIGDLLNERDEMEKALRAILEIAPACSAEAQELSWRGTAQGVEWRDKLRDAQRIAIVTLRKCGRRV